MLRDLYLKSVTELLKVAELLTVRLSKVPAVPLMLPVMLVKLPVAAATVPALIVFVEIAFVDSAFAKIVPA